MKDYNYINSHSWKCLLGKQSKNVIESNGLYRWEVGSKKHFCTDRNLEISDLDLIKGYNFHYLSVNNINFLKNHVSLNKSKGLATAIKIEEISLVGDKNKSLRYAINRGKKYGLVVEENYRNINDVYKMVNEWSNVLAQKYFRDNSSKNEHFYRNNWHLECHNVFLYDKDDLVSFGSASPGVDGYSSYVVGKALCNRYYGLSEYTDYLLYQKCLQNEIKIVDLGQTTGGMIFYKGKFGGSFTYNFYNGKINV